MWKLYLQYYLWRLLPRWFKQPAVLQTRQKTIREAKVVSTSYHLDFEKYKTSEHFIKHLQDKGYNLHSGPYQQHEGYMSQTIVLDKSLDAATLMPYFDANPWSDLKIRVGEKVIADAIVVNQAVLVPWLPGMKG